MCVLEINKLPEFFLFYIVFDANIDQEEEENKILSNGIDIGTKIKAFECSIESKCNYEKLIG